MKRFFGTSAVLRKIPPGAPAHVKEIPVPGNLRTTEEISKVLDHGDHADLEPPVERGPSKYLQSVLLSADSKVNLNGSEGVWYNIKRSRAGNLPVYSDFNKAGGVWTEVRKIEGSAGALKEDLKNALGLHKSEIWVKNAAPVVVIKGQRVDEVKALLETAF